MEGKKKSRRVPTQYHTRELDRGVARRKMSNMTHICKHGYHGAAWETVYDRSYFANHWREHIV